MVGAAGRGTGINITYLVPFFMERFGITASGGRIVSDRTAGRRARRTSGDRLVFGSFRQACRDHASYTLSIRNHDRLAGSSNLPGSAFYLNLILYGTVVEARGSLTQTMISDFAKDELTDAAFSIYYFIGCISGPIWTLIVGYVMERVTVSPKRSMSRRPPISRGCSC